MEDAAGEEEDQEQVMRSETPVANLGVRRCIPIHSHSPATLRGMTELPWGTEVATGSAGARVRASRTDATGCAFRERVCASFTGQTLGGCHLHRSVEPRRALHAIIEQDNRSILSWSCDAEEANGGRLESARENVSLDQR